MGPVESLISDALAACSPFFDVDGAKELDFDPTTGAVTETIGPPGKAAADGDPQVTELAGRFEIKARTGRVVTVIGRERREYSLVIPNDGTQCILAMGKAKTVDLERSWFAAPQDDQGSDTDQPDHRKAASGRPAPVPQLRIL